MLPASLEINGSRARRLLLPLIRRLPPVSGRTISIEFRPQLSASGGELLSSEGRGRPVHAGSDMRKRWMVLDLSLMSEPVELERIFVHELFHFAWVRLGNPARHDYEELLRKQFRARGELGWSAERLKDNLDPGDVRLRTRAWREYVCESFCDTAAWLHSSARTHPEWTLASSYRGIRRKWFAGTFAARPLSL